jgi:hypothetical protein
MEKVGERKLETGKKEMKGEKDKYLNAMIPC